MKIFSFRPFPCLSEMHSLERKGGTLATSSVHSSSFFCWRGHENKSRLTIHHTHPDLLSKEKSRTKTSHTSIDLASFVFGCQGELNWEDPIQQFCRRPFDRFDVLVDEASPMAADFDSASLARSSSSHEMLWNRHCEPVSSSWHE